MTTVLQAVPEVETLIPLSRVESRRLTECEAVIERGLDTFYDVGNALTEIRDSRLYRMGHATFENYCRDRWDMSRPRAYQFIGAAAVMENLSTIVDKPTNEAQTRELSPLDAEAQKAVWQIAIATASKNDQGKAVVTAGHINSVIKVISDIVDSGALDDGTGEMKPLGDLIDAAVTEETYERLQRQKEYIKQHHEKESERKHKDKSDRSEVEALYDPEIQERLARYMAMVTEFENLEWPAALDYLPRLFQSHKAHAHFQKTRNLTEDCDEIMTVINRLSSDPDLGFTLDAQELYDWLFDLGYCMSQREFIERMKHMSREDIRMALYTDAGDGKQDDRRGKLPGIVCLPWRKVWDQKSKRPPQDDDDEA